MNILSELIPGARQVRTPLAVGYLWLAVAWINAPRFENYGRKAALMSRTARDFGFDHLTPANIILALSFGAYLVGIFFQVLDSVLVIIAVVAGLSAGVGLAALLGPGILLILAIKFWWLSLLLAIGFVALVFFDARRHHTDMGNQILQWLINGTVPLLQLVYLSKRLALRIWSPAATVRADYESTIVANILDHHPEIVHRFCRTLSTLALRAACIEAGQGSDGNQSHDLSGDGSITLSQAAHRSWIDPDSEQILRDYLLAELITDRSAATSVILRVMGHTRIRSLVRDALNRAATRIQAERRALFDDSDRLRTEGERPLQPRWS